MTPRPPLPAGTIRTYRHTVRKKGRTYTYDNEYIKFKGKRGWRKIGTRRVLNQQTEE